MSQESTPEQLRARREQLLSTPAGAKILKISPGQFRRLMVKQGIAPEQSYVNPHRRSRRCPLWPPEPIRALLSSEEVVTIRARRGRVRNAKACKARDRISVFERRYPDWHDALLLAADGMFSLNRYAKHSKCQRAHREEIYALKSSFLKLLYHLGFAVEVKHHVANLEGRVCWRCGGTGVDDFDQDCERCNGTGWFREPSKGMFVAFWFRIGGRDFAWHAWHQPLEEVDWEYTLTAAADSWDSEKGEKLVPLSSQKFADAKQLVRWVIAKHRQQSQ